MMADEVMECWSTWKNRNNVLRNALLADRSASHKGLSSSYAFSAVTTSSSSFHFAHHGFREFRCRGAATEIRSQSLTLL